MNIQNRSSENGSLDIKYYESMLGEYAWYLIRDYIPDPTIESTSIMQYNEIRNILWDPKYRRFIKGLRILEVGCSAHTTGYKLSECGAEVTLFDISAKNLELGWKIAGYPAHQSVTRIAGDYHDLPFEEGAFDLLYVFSALHHAADWKRALSEMLRVLSPGGIFILGNEPSKREACFYSFRANRREQFTDFEKELDTMGVLRTFAEPFPGSRPEILFGMIENQQIPLNELVDELNRRAARFDLKIDLKETIGVLERAWINAKDSDSSSIARLISEDIRTARTKVLKLYTRRDNGIGFRLPTDEEIGSFADKVSRLIKDLPEKYDGTYDYKLAGIFGMNVKAILIKICGNVPRYICHLEKAANLFGMHIETLLTNKYARTLRNYLQKKKGLTTVSRACTRNCHYHNGVYYSFNEELSRVLTQKKSLLPSIQGGSAEELAKTFPRGQWEYYANPNALSLLCMKASPAHIIIIPAAENTLILLRFYIINNSLKGHRLEIKILGNVVLSCELWQSQGLLFKKIIKSPLHDPIVLEVARYPLDEGNDQNDAQAIQVNIPFALAFGL